MTIQDAMEFSMGPVTLQVRKIGELAEFYHAVVGLDLINTSEGTAELGTNGRVLLRLLANSKLNPQHPSHAGLYHFAVVYASRAKLAKTIQHIIHTTPHLFAGSADHLVSEAFYFTDPEGNGIELYFDRDRSLWQWQDGSVQMASLYIDPADYIRRNVVMDAADENAHMGHIHLKVGDIGKAREFYSGILGFDVTAQLPGALFVSFGGYHHHIGMNTWESFGAGERPESLGLSSFEFIFSGKAEVKNLRKRLESHSIPVEESADGFTFTDPWKNRIEIRSHGSYSGTAMPFFARGIY